MTTANKQEQSGSEPATEAAERELAVTAHGRRPDGDKRPKEVGGPSGPEPTRYGDWERAGRCVDF